MRFIEAVREQVEQAEKDCELTREKRQECLRKASRVGREIENLKNLIKFLKENPDCVFPEPTISNRVGNE